MIEYIPKGHIFIEIIIFCKIYADYAFFTDAYKKYNMRDILADYQVGLLLSF